MSKIFGVVWKPFVLFFFIIPSRFQAYEVVLILGNRFHPGRETITITMHWFTGACLASTHVGYEMGRWHLTVCHLFTGEIPHPKKNLIDKNSLFDLLGFFTPVVLEAPMIYKQELEWDKPTIENGSKRWCTWLLTSSKLLEVSIPQSFDLRSVNDVKRCQLHYFSHASRLAYWALCYLIILDARCVLCMGKWHLAPRVKRSNPCFEPRADITAMKINLMVKKEMSFQLCSPIF